MGGGGGVAGLPPRKFENCKLMCNCLHTLRIGRCAPDHVFLWSVYYVYIQFQLCFRSIQISLKLMKYFLLDA